MHILADSNEQYIQYVSFKKHIRSFYAVWKQAYAYKKRKQSELPKTANKNIENENIFLMFRKQ